MKTVISASAVRRYVHACVERGLVHKSMESSMAMELFAEIRKDLKKSGGSSPSFELREHQFATKEDHDTYLVCEERILRRFVYLTTHYT